MTSSMHSTNDWYLAVDGQSIGPLTTESVLSGIERGEVCPGALICAVGDTAWSDISTVRVFSEVLGNSEAASREALPSFHPEAGDDVLGDANSLVEVQWGRRFHSYFLLDSEIELPEESALLSSLARTPPEQLQSDEALWNLALCLAFGSDRVADAAARALFQTVLTVETADRLEWLCRTLLSRGFLPSGIPRSAGNRGLSVLRGHCTAALRPSLEREARPD